MLWWECGAAHQGFSGGGHRRVSSRSTGLKAQTLVSERHLPLELGNAARRLPQRKSDFIPFIQFIEAENTGYLPMQSIAPIVENILICALSVHLRSDFRLRVFAS